jgi:hypothetical protein
VRLSANNDYWISQNVPVFPGSSSFNFGSGNHFKKSEKIKKEKCVVFDILKPLKVISKLFRNLQINIIS